MPPVAVSSTYLLHPTPLGDILIVGTPDAVISCHPVYDDPGDDLAALTLALRAEPSPGTTDAALQLAAQLDEYFANQRTAFDLPLLLPGTPFQQKVWHALTEIPFGTTISYDTLAKRVGSVARAVGGANGANRVPIVVPCHRVIGADGSLTGFGGGMHNKQRLLELERAITPELFA